ncbi:recombinase RecQ, partial [Streptomyces durbertensis]
PWEYDAERYARVAQQRTAEQEAMREYVRTGACRMDFLRRQLDDPDTNACGRCDNCAGARFEANVSPESLAAAQGELVRAGVEVVPRRLWPSGLEAVGLPLKGRIPADEQASTGRALGRLSDIGWGNRLRPLFVQGAADGPVPDDVMRAAVGVLADWARSSEGWAGAGRNRRRPVAVVSVGSSHRPRLVTTLAEGIASIGRIPLLGSLSRSDTVSAPGHSNSAQRVRAVQASLALPPDLAEAVAAAEGPLLLVDDFTDTGWTLAVAARLLRQAGAPEVLPLVLAVQG